MCHYLLDKIKNDLIASSSDGHATGQDLRYRLDSSHGDDLEINSISRCVRTRLYFTSESHLHTLLNVLRYAGESEPCAIDRVGLSFLDKISELSYLTQVRHTPLSYIYTLLEVHLWVKYDRVLVNLGVLFMSYT